METWLQMMYCINIFTKLYKWLEIVPSHQPWNRRVHRASVPYGGVCRPTCGGRGHL